MVDYKFKFEKRLMKNNTYSVFKVYDNNKIKEEKHGSGLSDEIAENLVFGLNKLYKIENVWIPKPFEKVIYNGGFADVTAQVIECNLGGKCKIRIGLNTTMKNVDVSSLKKINE